MMKKLMLGLWVILLILPLAAIAEEYGVVDGRLVLEDTGLVLVVPDGASIVEPTGSEILHIQKGEYTLETLESNAGYKNIFVYDRTGSDIHQLISRGYEEIKEMYIDFGISEENIFENVMDPSYLFSTMRGNITALIESNRVCDIRMSEHYPLQEHFDYRIDLISKRIRMLYGCMNISTANSVYFIVAFVDASQPELYSLIEDKVHLSECKNPDTLYQITYRFILSDEEEAEWSQYSSVEAYMLNKLLVFENADEVMAATTEDIKSLMLEEAEEQLENLN